MKDILNSYDPSNGELVGRVNKSTVEQINEAVQKAKNAQKDWKKTPIETRVELIAKASNKVGNKAKELAQLLSREMGKDIYRSSGELQSAVYGAPYIANEVLEALTPQKKGKSVLSYEALGVVAVISPWNYPLGMAINLLIPALSTGNTVVFKSSEETPLIAQAYVDIVNEVLPDGVLNIVHGDSVQGNALVESDVNMIAFTGSMAAGRDIMKRAASSIKRLVMELGGNDPMIVLPDANLVAAARFAVGSSFENAGQMCTSTERIYVHESIADEFEQKVTNTARLYKIGAWNEADVNIGPIINNSQRDRIINHIDDAVNKGAKVLLGGKNHPERYINPTVLTGVTKDMEMSKDETFGPIVAISRYKDIDQAIDQANDSDYGLGAVVFGNKYATEVAQRLEAGMVGVNHGPGGGDMPWVGAKQSGFGYHGTADGHRQFAQVKVIG